MRKDDLLEVVESCVASLPHQVEWYSDEEIAKYQNGQPAQKTIEVQDTFILPHGIISMSGGDGALFDLCKQLADDYGCDFRKTSDGSFIFKSRR
jgi:hypothetical protein